MDASGRRGVVKFHDKKERGDYDAMLLEDNLGLPYVPQQASAFAYAPREENPVVFMDINASGGRLLKNGTFSQPQKLGRLHFELRCDLVPVACANFLSLIRGDKPQGEDGVKYHLKGVRLHRIVKNRLFQSGDLMDRKGECSRSIYNNGGLFRDENFIFRHAGAGCLSMCNRGPDTNGSLFQVTFMELPELDERHVVFGCIAESRESLPCLNRIDMFGTPSGEPLEDIRIADCGIAYPTATTKKSRVVDKEVIK